MRVRNIDAKLERIRRRFEQSPRHLDLAGLDLLTLPSWAVEHDLYTLYLKDNRLTTLPEELALHTMLRELDLRNNAFAEVPGVVKELVGLEELYLDANRITALPDWLLELPALSYVQVRDNCISEAERTRLGNQLGSLRVLC